MSQPSAELARQVAELLRSTGTRIVFAESCTAGLISAVLARIPGISDFHCGSAVVYRIDTKTKWLGVPESLLQEAGAVSLPVAEAMAVGVLERTPEANLSASITGHLGPNAPMEQDGQVVIGLARRIPSGQVQAIGTHDRRLTADFSTPNVAGAETLREWRQWQAAELVLSLVRDTLSDQSVNEQTSVVAGARIGPQ